MFLKERVMKTTAQVDVKSLAREVLDALPDNASWDELMYRLYVRQKIEAGIKDVQENRTMPVEEVRKRFGLTK
jgi:hypothetical protein